MARCSRDRELGRQLGVNPFASLAKNWEMALDLGVAASGKDGDQFSRGLQLIRGEKCFASLRRRNIADQWVSNEFNRYACVGKEFFFEREYAQRERESPPHDSNAPRPPGPELRADVINIAHAKRFQFARQPEMEAGKVRENRQRRPV